MYTITFTVHMLPASHTLHPYLTCCLPLHCWLFIFFFSSPFPFTHWLFLPPSLLISEGVFLSFLVDFFFLLPLSSSHMLLLLSFFFLLLPPQRPPSPFPSAASPPSPFPSTATHPLPLHRDPPCSFQNSAATRLSISMPIFYLLFFFLSIYFALLFFFSFDFCLFFWSVLLFLGPCFDVSKRE